MDLNEIRLKEHLGIVASDASTVQFSFFVTPLKNKLSVGKGDYVLIDHPVLGDGYPLVAVVKEVRNYEEVVGTTLGEKAVEKVAVGEIAGYVDLKEADAKPLRKLFVPPAPGSKVYLPYFEFLEDVFLRGFDGKTFEHTVYVGEVESFANCRNGEAKALSFCFDAEDFSRQHFLVTGMSGVGKTHTAIVLIEELANKTGFPVVVLDAFGEYATVGVAGERFKKLVADGRVEAKDYPFDFKVLVHACDADGVSKRLKGYGAEDRCTIKHVSSRWLKVTDEKVEGEIGEGLGQGVKRGQVLVVDGKGLDADERKKFFSCCVKSLWSGRVGGVVEPFVLIVEEAENAERAALEKIASEGRKFGVSMILLSQYPSAIDGRVLSQMGAQMVGRTTDAGQLECLASMAGEKCSLLPQLKIGEWIINGIGLRQPQKVFVREHYSV